MVYNGKEFYARLIIGLLNKGLSVHHDGSTCPIMLKIYLLTLANDMVQIILNVMANYWDYTMVLKTRSNDLIICFGSTQAP